MCEVGGPFSVYALPVGTSTRGLLTEVPDTTAVGCVGEPGVTKRQARNMHQ